jgi:hypothetical protein
MADRLTFGEQFAIFRHTGRWPGDPDAEAAAEGAGAYAAQNLTRNEQVRLRYDNEVVKLDKTDNAGRARLKKAYRTPTPAPQRSVISKVRPGYGPPPGTGGTANRPNSKATRVAKIGGAVGRGSGLISGALGAWEIATAEDRPRAAAGVAGSLSGGVAGGIAGAELGALAGTAIFPGAGTAAGALIGGLGGSVAGGLGGREVADEIYEFGRSMFSKPSPGARRRR